MAQTARDAATNNAAKDATFVTWRLEEAGRALLALPGTGYSTRLRTSNLEIVRTAMEAYGWTAGRVRPPVPSGAVIDRMDEAYGWLAFIPEEKYVLRRILGARSLVHPMTDRHLFPWRRLATALGADHKAVQRWWAQGVDMVVAGLGGGRPESVTRHPNPDRDPHSATTPSAMTGRKGGDSLFRS